MFRAETGSLVEPDELLRRAWDLDALADEYAAFIAEFGRRSPRRRRGRFAALVELVHGWRRFPLIDPEIPARLLPGRWPLGRAKQLFDARHGDWAPPAQAWYEERGILDNSLTNRREVVV